LLRFHEVTREEYDELLQLTNEEGQIAEGRLLSSPLSGIKHLASKTGLFSDEGKKKRVYPLCVISSDDDDDKERTLHGHGHGHGHNDGEETPGEGEGEEEENPVEHPSKTFCTLVVKGTSGNSNVIYQPRPKPRPKPKPQPGSPDPNHPNHPNHPNLPPHSYYPYFKLYF